MTVPKKVRDFSFADYAEDFDAHIRSSIPGYEQLIWSCIRLSRRFVQPDSVVIDVGCSTGRLLVTIEEHNRDARSGVSYIGLDSVPDFANHWGDFMEYENVRFVICDARSYPGFENASLVVCNFTIQFIPPPDKAPLLKRIRDGLLPGGALIIAEKTLASSSRLQDALAFPYFDYKLEHGFSEKEILDKERSLRGLMTSWTEDELKQALLDAGFRTIQLIWGNFGFVGFLALR
jgi:tRNA (cmo5U34)-methyltransferase